VSVACACVVCAFVCICVYANCMTIESVRARSNKLRGL